MTDVFDDDDDNNNVDKRVIIKLWISISKNTLLINSEKHIDNDNILHVLEIVHIFISNILTILTKIYSWDKLTANLSFNLLIILCLVSSLYKIFKNLWINNNINKIPININSENVII